MIKQIRGTVVSTDLSGAVIDVSGFGVFVHLAESAGLAAGETVTVLTHMAVKQDGIDLYGFTDSKDLQFFGMLLSVSGVGPKTALSIMKRASRESLESAIGKRDITYLTRVVGLGKKAAEKLAVELSEKIGAGETEHDEGDAEVFDTLVALGYTEREARKTLAAIPQSVSGKDARLKAALSSSH